MIVIGLDGQEHRLKLNTEAQPDENCSQYHLAARLLLKELFPVDTICEEVVLPGTDGLRFDFLLPLWKIAVEVQGQQHYHFNKFFHRDILTFAAAKKRDAAKREFCKINRFTLIELRYNEQREWREQIRKARL